MVIENRTTTTDDRIERINKLILELASGNLEARETPSENFDETDAVIAGINMLGEELQSSTVSRNYLKSIYEGIVDMVIILSEEGNIQSVNSAVVNLLGYAEHEMAEMHFVELFNSGSEIPLAFMEHLQEGRSLHNIEGTLRSRDGRNIPVNTTCSVLFNSKGQTVGMLLVAKDITVQKQIEEELRKSKEAAELSNRMKSTFLANMSHEIRTPLNGILGFTEYLMGMEIPAEQKEYLTLIQNSGQTLMKLLSDILDLNKIEVGKLELDQTPIHFKEVMSSSLVPYKYMANEKGLGFDLEFENFEEIPHVSCDPTRVNQVLVNLVGNALKFTKKGKIKVKLSIQKNGPFSKTATITGAVSDTGIGIESDKQNDVFKAFTQSDSSITRRFGGTGLGLSIVKELLQLMGGNISIHTPERLEGAGRENPGTEFRFQFIVGIAEQAAEPMDTETDSTHFEKPYKILVVEDNEMNRLLAGKVLGKMGAMVEFAEHGKEAVYKVKDKRYDCILMDVQMPVMDGLEATRVIRRLGYKLPIIGLSANVFKEDIDKSRSVGMNDHLGKPFTKVSIFRTLRKVLENAA